MKVKDFCLKYRHALWMVCYLPIYLIVFFIAEHTVTSDYFVIECALDRYIPFNEWFILPYFLWFPYIAVGVLYFIFTNKNEYYRLSASLITGMTVFLIVSFVFPNGLTMRPDLSALGRDNIALRLLGGLHKADTQTNVCPSIHVYNSLAVCFAVCTASRLKKKLPVKLAVVFLTVMICLSTMFLKQHSVIDVIAAVILFLVLTPVCYLVRRKKTN